MKKINKPWFIHKLKKNSTFKYIIQMGIILKTYKDWEFNKKKEKIYDFPIFFWFFWTTLCHCNKHWERV